MSPQETRKWYRTNGALISFHILGWLLILLLPAILHREKDQEAVVNWKASFNITYLIIVVSFSVVFYLNAFLLIPQLLSRKKVGAYVGILLLMAVAFIVGLELIPNPDKHHKGLNRESIFLVFPFLFYWATSTAYRFFMDKVKTEQLMKERENSNLKTELSFLRSQISPHFLFNVLNNMVAMARLKSEKLEPSLIRLSGLMRYMLYESDDSKVPLTRETEYVQSYVELQKLRYDSSLKIEENYEINGDGLIEPMLLIPFIENAFKHGTGMIVDPVICISLRLEGDKLFFAVKNKMYTGEPMAKDNVSGIGLTNVERRLNLLYAGQYQLDISEREDWFSVSLQLNLHTA